MALDPIADYNNEVSKWAAETKNASATNLDRLQIHESGDTEAALRYNVKRRYGEPEKISFRTTKQGVLIHAGVGKGRKLHSTRAEAAKKLWLFNEIDERMDKLADIAGKFEGDVAVRRMRIGSPSPVTPAEVLNQLSF